jgi:aminomethyltransferase
VKRTALYSEHVRLRAKMVDFAGWELPVMYTSIIEEHLATREHVALFDTSHMGEIVVRGEGAEKLLRRLIPTRMDKLEPNRTMYSCLCNERGGVIDDLFIYMISQNEYYLVVNASNIEKDEEWLRRNTLPDTEIINRSTETAKVDLQGPHSGEILARVIRDNKLNTLKRFSFLYTEFNNEMIMISRTGYTGEQGFELYLHNDNAENLWKSLIRAGEDSGLKAAGLGARDSLRIEACYSLYGHELSEEISPVEAGLSWIVSSEDDFIGRDALLKQKAEGAPREIVCIELVERGVPREGYRVEKNGEDIGHVTSGVFSPTFKKGIAMALAKSGVTVPGDSVSVIIRDKPVRASIVKRPFYAYNG